MKYSIVSFFIVFSTFIFSQSSKKQLNYLKAQIDSLIVFSTKQSFENFTFRQVFINNEKENSKLIIQLDSLMNQSINLNKRLFEINKSIKKRDVNFGSPEVLSCYGEDFKDAFPNLPTIPLEDFPTKISFNLDTLLKKKAKINYFEEILNTLKQHILLTKKNSQNVIDKSTIYSENIAFLKTRINKEIFFHKYYQKNIDKKSKFLSSLLNRKEGSQNSNDTLNINKPLDKKLSEDVSEEVIEEEYLFDINEKTEFPGGETAMNKFIQDKTKSFNQLNEEKVSGLIEVLYKQEIDGSISKAFIINGMPNCPKCEKEALRIVKQMPRWKPAMHNGKPISYYFSIKIQF